MDIRTLQRAIVDGLEDVKAQHISVFNTEHLSSMFERVIIASGTSNRQTKALAASVRNSVKQSGMPVLNTEGEDNGECIIVDCGAAVANIMHPSIREYYHLEEIWGGKAVRMKVGEVNTRLVKASEPEPRSARSGKPSRPAKPAAPVPAKRAPVRAAPAKAAPARKPAARTAADKQMANKTSAYKRVAAKTAAKAPAKAPVRAGIKTVVVKAPARKSPRMEVKTVARKTPPRKTASRKTSSRS